MSTDLELALPLIKTKIPNCDNNLKIDSRRNRSCVSSEDEKEQDEECHTPRSPRHMIPAIVSCPPAPRKPAAARRRSSCKRKMCDELKFFEIVARDEIESFFRVAEKNINGAKRRCVI